MLVNMKQQSATEAFLTPSQLIILEARKDVDTHYGSSLTPSQVVIAACKKDANMSLLAATNDISSSDLQQKNSTKKTASPFRQKGGSDGAAIRLPEDGERRRRRLGRRKNNHEKSTASIKNGGSGPQKLQPSRKSKHRKRIARTGRLPDIYWRSIPMDHLRMHPSFVALPEVPEFSKLETLEDVRYFRQESWQWE